MINSDLGNRKKLFIIRFNHFLPTTRDALPISETQLKDELRTQIWFNLAGDPVPNMVESLLKFTGKERLMFGSDVPWTTFEAAQNLVQRMETELEALMAKEAIKEIWSGTAERLLGLQS